MNAALFDTARSPVAASQTFNRVIDLVAFATAVLVTTEFLTIGLLPQMARGLEISLVEVGSFVTWFAMSAAILGPFVTVAVAGLPSRFVLATALVVFGLGNVIIALIPHYSVIAVIRIVQGAGLPVFVSVANVALAQLVGAHRRGAAIARVNVGTVAASLLGMPAAVALADHHGWAASFLVLGGLALVAGIALATSFPKTESTQAGSVRSQLTILRQISFQGHLLLSAVLFTAMFAAYTYVAAFLETVAGLNGREVAFALIGFGVAGLAGNWVAGRMVDRRPIGTTAWVAFVLVLTTGAVSLIGEKSAWLIPLIGVWGAAHNAAFVACQVRVMVAGARARAFALSLNISACNLGIAAGAFIGGGVVRNFGVGAIGYWSAALSVCALLIALVLRRSHSATPARSS